MKINKKLTGRKVIRTRILKTLFKCNIPRVQFYLFLFEVNLLIYLKCPYCYNLYLDF